MPYNGRVVIVGGSDAGIQAGLRARELSPDADVTVLVADEYPNFSICGLPYWLGGEVGDWHNLAHRTIADLESSGLNLRLDTPDRSTPGDRDGQVAKRIDIPATAIFAELTIDQISDLDLSYSPPFGSPWDALQAGAQTLSRKKSGIALRRRVRR